MANFVYLVGDDATRECMVVDPAWDIKGIIDFVEQESMRLVGALVTHYHPDHVGGDIFGHNIAGLGELLSLNPVKVHVNE
jgi:glyoxylase-like metal-dependent hydrolase (beta-lactamase superfamily II)